MIEITTSNSTKVNELLFAFGNRRDEVKVISMTTPTLTPFHQKIFAHAKSATDIYLTKNNPFRLYPDSVGAWRPLRAKARPGNAGREQSAFTLIELLAVITIIGILAGLTLGAAGAVRRHGASSTAKTEVAALQAACDRYFADNSTYPIGTADPIKTNNPAGATALFTNLLGSATLTNAPTSKRYFEPKPAMVSGNYFIDPWGYAYGYNSDGTNAPLIWSTAGGGNTNRWITSWPKM
ncbi:MAG: prepilin-type N-terminal cleavage/methylation domain-containing protein [Patescibacteria group bacterium]|nr:prepilin-type N-terminal cleavage/methylation domain-containing protein [Patescibacteria group bacterium]